MIRREKRFFTQTIKIFCKWSGSNVALFCSPTAASALYSTHVQISTFLCLSVFYLILTHSYSDGCVLGSYLARAYFKPSADASLHLQSSSRRISWKLICISTTNSWNWCVMCRVGEQVKWSVWHVSSQLLEIWCLVRLEINLHESCLERWVIVCVHINYMSLLLWHRYFLL